MGLLTLIMLGLVIIAAILLLFFFAPFPRGRGELAMLGAGLTLLLIIGVAALVMPAPKRPTFVGANAAAQTASPVETATNGSVNAEVTATTEVADAATAAATALDTATPEPTATVAAPAETTSAAETTEATGEAEPTATTAVATSTPTTAPATATTRPTTAPTRVPAVVPSPTAASGPGTVRVPSGNVRSAPSETSPVIGAVNAGDELVFLGVSGEWYLVRLGDDVSAASSIPGGQGWISAAIVNPPAQQPPAVAPPRANVTPSPTIRRATPTTASASGTIPTTPGTVRAEVANVRSGPSTTASVVGTVYRGDELRFVGVNGAWYLVELGDDVSGASTIRGTQGWIAAEVLNPPSQRPPVVNP